MSASTVEILVVDDEPAQLEVLAQRLRGWGHSVVLAADVSAADAALRQSVPDLVLSDVVLPGLSGLDLLRHLKSFDASVPVILMTAHGSVDVAVEAMKAGALDFLTKPIDWEALRLIVAQVSEDRAQRADDRSLDAVLGDPTAESDLVGVSAAVRRVRTLVEQVAPGDAAVLITGESGTGKEVVARRIHARGARARGPFIAVNVAAIPEGLIESEVFGHEAGAFSGALKARAGCFELADNGTLLLDEVAEMPVSLQPKLLRVLEDGRVRRLGAAAERTFNVRVIAATNRDVATAVREGALREDLLYRLNVFEIALPPLRERTEDIPLLCRHFIRRLNAKHGARVESVRRPTLERLAAWHWPGNIRELRNVLERAVVLAREGWLEPSHLPPYLTAVAAARPVEVPPDATLADAERLLVLSTLERTGQNKAEAARRLGLDVKTIRNKLKQWGIGS